jgi:hypothetical protein
MPGRHGGGRCFPPGAAATRATAQPAAGWRFAHAGGELLHQPAAIRSQAC